ncbi:hypothetical protein BCV69DRAFT_311949 [Microstroma glucosiphilum]|uniref:Uncharacterized protein n=1 Tax=Pseudomicrostroma glucosiphilum TaxID=1684307 RepID=A0A316U8F2_9BASI|nr:hypothetical protein BCV69DRAFT_311949 [Pseudomicrostroma glucosiphilum]PWN21442.1 hypothetical protein BCV69DRAFT_311949 [Pseudomicrostroma glucosiphilum]
MTTTPRPLLLVRRPSPLLSSGQLTHLAPASDPPKPSRSLAQWQGYCDVFRSQLGWEVIEVDAADDCPDGVFLEDAMIVFPALDERGGGVVVLVRSGSPERRGEYESARRATQEHLVPRGYEVFDFNVEDKSGEATLDGGDILKILPGASSASHATTHTGTRPPTVYVGQSTRTNALGTSLLKKCLEPRGWSVQGVPVQHHLHLKSAITALPDGQVIGHSLPRSSSSSSSGSGSGTSQPSVGVTLPDGHEILPIQEEHGIAVVDVSSPNGSPKVLLSADAPRTKKQLEQRGYEVVTVDIGDFEKMEGW